MLFPPYISFYGARRDDHRLSFTWGILRDVNDSRPLAAYEQIDWTKIEKPDGQS